MSTKEPQTMAELVEEAGSNLIPVKQGEVIEVYITSISKSRIIADVKGLCLGIIPEREFSFDVSEFNVGDKVLAYVLSLENDEGHMILSLRRADRERLWRTLEEKSESGELLTVKVAQANRGGLMVNYGDIEGFLPVSQLSSAHYPRVAGGDRDLILGKLNELVNQSLRVKIISYDRTANKLIFSEKAAGDTLQEEKALQFTVGQELTGKITGIVDFGIFVNIGEIEGLVHVSEISWERVDSPQKLFKPGDEVKVIVIGVDNGRVSLSMKRLLPDPWNTEIAKFKAGDVVSGEVTRVTPFGAFVRINDRLEGLVHISEIAEKGEDVQTVIQEGKSYSFRILTIEPESHKISLSLKQATKTKEVAEKTEPEDKKEEAKKPAAKKATKKETAKKDEK